MNIQKNNSPYLPVILLHLLFSISCNGIDKQDLKVIDDIQLGTTMTEFDSLSPTLNIKRASFLTSVFFLNYDFKEKSVTFPYTSTFDFSDFKSDRTKHLGLLYPGRIPGTNNITSLIVILVHTEKPFFILPNEVEPQDIRDEYISISQHISSKVIDGIVNMYNSKYGLPKDTITEPLFLNLYKIEGDKINSYSPPDVRNLYRAFVWETKYFKVRLFRGLPSSEEKFDKKSKRYVYNIGTNSQGVPEIKEIKVDYENGETMCESYPYIFYELKKEAIDKLKLDNKKI
jgi:hypothetical protein